MQIGLGQNRSYQLAETTDAILISLSENGLPVQAGEAPSWQLDVYAETLAGRDYLGSLNTVAAVNGIAMARFIGYAVAPGARSWTIEATGPQHGPQGEAEAPSNFFAELRAHPARCSPSALPGVYRVQGRTILNGALLSETGQGQDTALVVPTAPLASVRTDFTAAIAFTGAFGSNETNATIWIMFFNFPSQPANGTQPFYGLSIAVPAGATFNFVAPGSPAQGIFFDQGLTWVASSTPNTLTAIAPGATARVVTQAMW